jgi:hypothetical protein
VRQKNVTEISKKPTQSHGSRAVVNCLGPSAISRSPAAARATGTTPKKIHAHDWLSINHPWSAGAMVAGATTDPIANSACRIGWQDRG